MEIEKHSHRFGLAIVEEPQFRDDWKGIISCLDSITDEDIIRVHKEYFNTQKSISKAINKLVHDLLTEELGWTPEASIFNDPDYTEARWRLDFAKSGTVSIEVAFNHGEAIAWNLLKPVLASELNHVEKQEQTYLGVVIMATDAMKQAGGFDSSVGTYEKAIRYLKPLQNQLSCPMVLIGLKAPRTFRVEHDGKPKRARFVDIIE